MMSDMRFVNRSSLLAAAAIGGTILAYQYRARKARGRWPVHPVLIDSSDGVKVRAFVRFPDGPGPHPAVVLLHGGHGGAPRRALVMAHSRVAAALLAAGYAIISVAYRRHAWMRGEVDDALAGYRYMARHPYIDPNCIAILGNSHGGSIALVAGPKTDAMAIIEYCGVTDVAAMHRHLTATNLRARLPLVREAIEDLKKLCGGTYEQCPDVYHALSPALQVPHMQCPIMIVHGANDAVVPVQHAQILREALEAAQHPHEIHVFPKMPHSFQFQNRAEAREAISRTVAFLNSCLAARSQAPAA
jgi:dipeptidyl aminopeptidase/acylaminoacyl peptidase